MFDGHWRSTVEKAVDPIGHSLRKVGLTADVLTVSGILIAGAAAVVIGRGNLKLGLLLLILSGLNDLLDGPVAKAAGTTSARGAFFDSVSDRVSDVLLFSGIAWHLSVTRPGSQISMLPVAILGAALLISYQRAKAESLGFDAKGGIMERAERFIVISIGLFFSSILIPVMWVMLALTIVTALQRFAKVWGQASETVPDARPRREATSR